MQTSDSALERRRSGQRGSALLIVFVFAAFVAIMLYKEMPVTIFEAKRQKEQLLIDRGSEYKRAIKLFVIRNRTFPTSLDQLEKFNNVRYIRHRFKDPMTGQSEWRLIHVTGPGFVLTDSKVTPLKKVDEKTSFAGSSSGKNVSAGQNQAGAPTASTDQTVQQQNAQPTVGSVAYVTPGQPVVYHLYPSQANGQPASQATGQPQAQAAALARSRPAVPATNYPAAQQTQQQAPAYQVPSDDESNSPPPGSMPDMLVSGESSETVIRDTRKLPSIQYPTSRRKRLPLLRRARP